MFSGWLMISCPKDDEYSSQIPKDPYTHTQKYHNWIHHGESVNEHCIN